MNALAVLERLHKGPLYFNLKVRRQRKEVKREKGIGNDIEEVER